MPIDLLERSSLAKTFNVWFGGRLEVLFDLIKDIFALVAFLWGVLKRIYSIDAIVCIRLEYCFVRLMDFGLKWITYFITVETFILLSVWSVNTIKRIISKRILIRVKLFFTFHALGIKRIHLWLGCYHITEIPSLEMLLGNFILRLIIL